MCVYIKAYKCSNKSSLVCLSGTLVNMSIVQSRACPAQVSLDRRKILMASSRSRTPRKTRCVEVLAFSCISAFDCNRLQFGDLYNLS